VPVYRRRQRLSTEHVRVWLGAYYYSTKPLPTPIRHGGWGAQYANSACEWLEKKDHVTRPASTHHQSENLDSAHCIAYE
jgi:hypothetical protein